ncbi:hypothetical protein ACFLX8_04455 [Chloroflexota bacterium]
MRSKKMLFIVLVVAVAIFFISLVIGTTWWQAALFSIGFLLIAAIVSTRGVILPEKVFDRVTSNEPLKVAGKDGFLERMDSELADLSEQPGVKVEDITWMTGYTRVMKGVGELVYEVHESVQSKDKARELRAFREVGKRLPHFINDLESIPDPVTSERQKDKELRIEGMELYYSACSDFIEALEKGDGNLAGHAAMRINKALDLLDVMEKSSNTSR